MELGFADKELMEDVLEPVTSKKQNKISSYLAVFENEVPIFPAHLA